MIAAERGMIATFMPKPFADRTGSGLHLHLSLTSGGAPVFPADDGRARTRAVRDRLRVHRRHPRPRLRAAGRHRANGQLLQANRCDHHRVRARRGHRARRATAATTAPTTSGCPTTSASSCAAATGRPTRTWRSPRRWAPASTASSAAPTPVRSARSPTAARRCRRRCCTPSTNSRPTRSSPGCSTPPVTVWRPTSPASSATEFFAYHSAVTPWEIDQYLTAF